MQKRIAVVFDSAGTLLHMYRAARESHTGSILENIESTLLVAQKPHRALVVLHTTPEKLLEYSPQARLVEFIDEGGIEIDISCSSSPFTIDEAFDIIRRNDTQIGHIHDVLQWVMQRCGNISYISQGVILDGGELSVPYVLSTAGDLYTNSAQTIRQLNSRGVDAYIASGDSMRNLSYVADSLGIPIERVFGIATTHDKERIVNNLKNVYDSVVMVGDGMNDILALRAADVGIMSVQQGDGRPDQLKDAADSIVNDIIEVVDIVDNL